jgi:hypothetical protein
MLVMLRLVAATAFLVAATAAAHAQAPGDVPVSAPGMMMGPPPPPGFVGAGAGPVDVMGNRWAVGLSLGSLSLAPQDAPDAETRFGIGELSLRFRVTPHLEVEGAFGGGRQQLQDGTQGDLEIHTGLLAARYRFSPAEHWNWWLMGGLGAVAIAQHGATDQTFQDAERPMAALGIGLEHRWQQFALHAELRGVGVGPHDDGGQPKAQPLTMTTDFVAPTTADHLSGGTLTLGASYYF